MLVKATPTHYYFYVQLEGTETLLGAAQTKYLSSEVAGGFTGVLIGLYVTGETPETSAEFTHFSCVYS
ncbi:hypothetical protein [Paenibacillus monticola]|uniref:beta-xylosidase family glycoside hydrolase n=1 Tax=Paenibacillus monticola TaxID=2666075 RepID=UPI001E3EAD6C|nr:hypothetical protein [Paenibacillus monticola]